jgi:GNAT superfamily N-acetyltransferase
MLSVDLDLARRLEIAYAWRGIHYAQARGRLRPEVEIAVQSVGGGYAIDAGRGSPVNRAMGLGLHGPVDGTDLASVEQFYGQRGAVPRVDLCPLADLSLLQVLRCGGYRLEQFYSVLVRYVVEDAHPVPLPPGVRVRKVGSGERELWLRTVAQGFTGAAAPPQEAFDILAPNFASATAIPYLAWVDGQPAGGGAMVTHGGVAELCSDSTRTAFRRQGVQSALIRARLVAAREAGCDLAMALTAPGSASQRNMERASFRLAYTKAVMGKETAGGHG